MGKGWKMPDEWREQQACRLMARPVAKYGAIERRAVKKGQHDERQAEKRAQDPRGQQESSKAIRDVSGASHAEILPRTSRIQAGPTSFGR